MKYVLVLSIMLCMLGACSPSSLLTRLGFGNRVEKVLVEGRVVDQAGNPIQEAAIGTKPLSNVGELTAIGIGTREDGTFSHSLPVGVYELSAWKSGYTEHKQEVHVAKPMTQTLVFVIEPDPTNTERSP